MPAKPTSERSSKSGGYDSPAQLMHGQNGSRQNQRNSACGTRSASRQTSMPCAMRSSRPGSSKALELEDGIPVLLAGLADRELAAADCVAMLTGDGGVGKSRLALQLAWALSGDGQWLGEAGQMPPSGADYSMGFEPLGPRKVVYATWEDSPAQIRGRLYWLEQSDKVGDGRNFKIADMRSRGHLWAQTERSPIPGLTPAGEELRLSAEQHDASLLVIDTLGVANGASEIDRAQVGAFFADWAAWADESDCTVLLIAHPPKTPGVAYSGSTGMLGGVRAMWNIESVKQDCRGECDSPRSCKCEPAYAYRLVNAKQNYSETTGSVWLTNRRGVWIESAGRKADYGIGSTVAPSSTNTDQGNLRDMLDGNI